MVKKMEAATAGNIERVLEILRSHGVLHIRGIAKFTGLLPATVEWIVNTYLIEDFVDEERVELGGIKLRSIRLKAGKENATVKDVLKYKELRKSLK